MSAIRAGVPIEQLPGTTALYRDYAAGSSAPIHRRLGDFRAPAESWRRALALRPSVDSVLIEKLVHDNAALGVSSATLERLRGLGDGRTRAVVTGQQPGVVGGPLLSLYKAATSVALAREIEDRWRVPCVPVFWLGSDDDDFAEIRELAVLGASLAVVSVSVDGSAHAPGRRVGDVAGSAVAQAWDAVKPFLPNGDGSARLGDRVRGWADLGQIAARVLVELTAGKVVIVDGREPLFRTAARDTLLAFFDRDDQVRAWVTEGGESLIADGYHAQLDAGSDSGLFLVHEGPRRRIPTDARARARAEFVRDITSASPGVVARNLVQDAVLAPAAVVLGPAEIAYRAQIVHVYDELKVGAPVVFPRLAATFLPPAVAEVLAHSGTDAALLVSDPAAWVERVTRSIESPRAVQAARGFEGALRAEAARFLAAAGERLDARAREKLERRVADLVNRAAGVAQSAVEQDALAGVSQWPWLARAAEMFARDGDAQERFLSAVVPYTFHSTSSWDLVHDVAASHVRDALDGRVVHRVYSR